MVSKISVSPSSSGSRFSSISSSPSFFLIAPLPTQPNSNWSSHKTKSSKLSNFISYIQTISNYYCLTNRLIISLLYTHFKLSAIFCRQFKVSKNFRFFFYPVRKVKKLERDRNFFILELVLQSHHFRVGLC